MKTMNMEVILDDKTNLHIVGDGAPWIEEQIEKNFRDQANFLIDFYHMSQYLAEASKCCCPESHKDWLRSSQASMKEGKVEKVLSLLKIHQEECSMEKDMVHFSSKNLLTIFAQ